ncbi:kinase-like domain-containing protein [Cladorrhinum sp. PSN259]|nr:kinase-like domain-containing protein [Cladorrhinum sp. PSN259]
MDSRSIFHQLDNATVTSSINDERFLPLDQRDKIVTIDAITKTVQRPVGGPAKLLSFIWPSPSPQLPKQIHQEAKNIFTILVLIGHISEIEGLLNDGLTDKDLPLSRKDNNTDILISKATGREFASFNKWNPPRVKQFLRDQWVVQAPVFEQAGETVHLEQDCPLPFISLSEDGTIEKLNGGASDVWVHPAQIHPAHRSESFASSITDSTLAVKEIGNESAFITERDNLERLKSFPHRHLIKLLGIIEQVKLFYFIFPWAHGGDLRQFWEHADSHPFDETLVLWSLRQILGLVDGLKLLHEKGIRHGDIKPQNVLHFTDPRIKDSIQLGTLVLGDVGVSKFHRDATHVRHWATKTHAVTVSYEAPEAEHDQEMDIPRSRLYDMWSLGCMSLEFTVWLLYGFEAVETFRRRRTSSKDFTTAPGNFFTQGSRGPATIHSEVSRGINYLRRDPRCAEGTALGDLVTLIEQRLLKIVPQERAKAPELHEALEKIIEKAEKDSEYLCKIVEPTPAVPKFFCRGKSSRTSSSTSSSYQSSVMSGSAPSTRGSRASFSSTGSSGRSSRSSVAPDRIPKLVEEGSEGQSGQSL